MKGIKKPLYCSFWEQHRTKLSFIETLSETSRGQNFKRLTHILEINAFKFFIEFDISVKALQNKVNINVHGKHIVIYLCARMLNSVSLYKIWQHLFQDFESNINTGTNVHEKGLVRGDYLQDLKVKKAETTRKQM